MPLPASMSVNLPICSWAALPASALTGWLHAFAALSSKFIAMFFTGVCGFNAGAEGMVFGPEEDLGWLEDPELILMETHDFFAGYFGLEASILEKCTLELRFAHMLAAYKVMAKVME